MTIPEEKKKNWYYICKVFEYLKHIEPKKHGCYYVHNFGEFELRYDTYNGCHYLQHAGVSVDLVEYIDILYNEVRSQYKLPSTLSYSEADLMDYLYLTDERFTKFFNQIS